MATKTEKEKKRKCSVLTKHVKEYIKKEEEDKKKRKQKQKQKKSRKTNHSFSNHCFFICGDPIHVISYIRSGKLIFTRLGHTIIGDDAYLLGFK